MNKSTLFQSITLAIKLPSGEISKQTFIGPALADKQTFNQIKSQSLAESIHELQLSEPITWEEIEPDYMKKEAFFDEKNIE